MIQQLIDQYVKAGGRAPYAVLFAPGVYDDVPHGVFVAWTPIIDRRVVVLPLMAASALLHESFQIVQEPVEEKETHGEEKAEG